MQNIISKFAMIMVIIGIVSVLVFISLSNFNKNNVGFNELMLIDTKYYEPLLVEFINDNDSKKINDEDVNDEESAQILNKRNIEYKENNQNFDQENKKIEKDNCSYYIKVNCLARNS